MLGRTLHRSVATVAVACATLVLAGCGGSSSPSTAKPKASPTPTPLTTAKAQSLAAAGILTSADLPGYASKPQTHDATDTANDKKMQDCLGLPMPTYLTRNFGTSFTKGTVEFDSSADVASSVSGATTQLTALKGPKAATCFEQVVKEALAGAGVTAKSATATPVPMTVPGSDGSFGYQLAVTARAQGQTIKVTGFEVGSLVGQVEIEIGAITFGTGSISLDQTTALLTKVTGRVKAAY